MSDGANINLFQKALISAPQATKSKLIFPWKKSIKAYDISSFSEQFTKGLVKTEKIQQLTDTMKDSEYHDPDLPIQEKIRYIGIAGLILITLLVPSWLILTVEDQSMRFIALGLFFIVLAIFSPSLSVLLYRRAVRLRLEAREAKLKEILKQMNSSTFNKHGMPVRISLFGAYLSIDRPMDEESKESVDEEEMDEFEMKIRMMETLGKKGRVGKKGKKAGFVKGGKGSGSGDEEQGDSPIKPNTNHYASNKL